MKTIFISLIGLAPTALESGTPPIHSLAIGPGTPPVVYAGTSCAGIFKSSDGGATWRAANDGLTRKKVDVLAIDLRAPFTVLAGAGSRDLGRYAEYDLYTYAIFRSTDGGASWVETVAGRKKLEGGPVDAIIFDRANPGTVHALMRFRYLKSADGGATWTTPRKLPSGIRALALDPLNPGVVFLVASGQSSFLWDIFRGEAGGKWKELYSDLPKPAGLLMADPVRPSTLYAAEAWWIPTTGPRDGGAPRPASQAVRRMPGIVVDGRKMGGFFKSTDGGVNWSVLKQGLPAEGISALAVHPSNPAILYAASIEGVFKSIDGGLVWTRASNGLVDVRGLAIAIDPADPETLYLGTDYGVFKSTDGAGTWKPMNQGLSDCVAPEAAAVRH